MRDETLEMDMENRMVTTSYLPEDEGDNPLRPRALSEFIGQTKVKENLSVFIDAARQRGEALGHALLYGPPDLAKQRLRELLPTK